jgi:hypothetical protein
MIAIIFVALILVEAHSNGTPCCCSSKFNQLMDVNDTVLLMLDHQTGLLQTVHDQSARDARALAGVLIKAASLRGIPIITTASEPTGPNGPLLPEIAQFPNALFVRRQGEISAWDNPNFLAAVQNSGKKNSYYGWYLDKCMRDISCRSSCWRRLQSVCCSGCIR